MVNQVPKMTSVTGIYRISNKMLKLRHAGFTLMEVMLVILLMGLTAAAVTMSIGNSGPQQALDRTARQFIAATEMVLDETVLSGQFIGIVIEKTSYQFVFYKDGKWEPLDKDRLLSEKQMEPGVVMNLVLDGLPLVQDDEEDDSWFEEPLIEPSADDKKKHPEPQVMLFPSGEMSAFELTFITKTDKGQQVEALVVGDALGRLTIGRPDETR
ncbi:type II secretion system protein H [Shewanella baltica]|nr:type II secretion system protein H [Shewanella baltica]